MPENVSEMSGITTTPAQVYDAVPYHSHAFPQAQPTRLAMLGKLFGLSPKTVNSCRVLELGCASGGNLIPLAARYPESHFVGIDFSEVQTQKAKETIKALSLSNIEIIHTPFEAYQAPDKKFDYVISHGVYSWVSPDIQQVLLKVAADSLDENGIAYVSYNTYPGWKLREVIRDAMIFHAGHLNNPAQRVHQARAMIDFMQRIADPESVFGKLLKIETDLLKQVRDDYLFHDHLEINNRPCYFKDFVLSANNNGLSYLGESNWLEMLPQQMGPEVFQMLETLSGGNIILTEQYMDFFRNRYFRSTLLVPTSQNEKIKRNLNPAALSDYHIAGYFETQETLNLDSTTPTNFIGFGNKPVSALDPLSKSALSILGEHFPSTLSFTDLLKQAKEKSSAAPSVDKPEEVLSNTLFGLAINGLIEIHSETISVNHSFADKPKAFRVAIYQANHNENLVANLRHETIRLDALQLEILKVADGTRDHAALKDVIIEKCLSGGLVLRKEDQPIIHAEAIKQAVPVLFEDALRKLKLWSFFE